MIVHIHIITLKSVDRAIHFGYCHCLTCWMDLQANLLRYNLCILNIELSDFIFNQGLVIYICTRNLLNLLHCPVEDEIRFSLQILIGKRRTSKQLCKLLHCFYDNFTPFEILIILYLNFQLRALEETKERIAKIQDLFRDSDATEFIIVTIPTVM